MGMLQVIPEFEEFGEEEELRGAAKLMKTDDERLTALRQVRRPCVPLCAPVCVCVCACAPVCVSTRP